MHVLSISNLKKTFFATNSLQNFTLDIESFTIHSGDILVLLGPNGSGKTTLIKLIFDLLFPASGVIKIFGENSKNKKSRKNLGYLPEEYSLPPNYTFKEILYTYGVLYGVDKFQIKKEIDFICNYLNLTKYINKQVKNLSKGMKQSLMLVLSLLSKPKFLIIDEPFVGLDPVQKQITIEYLKSINQTNNTTILITTHLLVDVQKIANKAALIKDGTIIEVIDKIQKQELFDNIENHYIDTFK